MLNKNGVFRSDYDDSRAEKYEPSPLFNAS